MAWHAHIKRNKVPAGNADAKKFGTAFLYLEPILHRHTEKPSGCRGLSCKEKHFSHLFIMAILVFLFSVSCTERARINPFDFRTEIHPDEFVFLYTTERENGFLLEPVFLQPLTFDSIFVYRSEGTPEYPQKIASFHAEIDSFIDISPPVNKPLYYSLSLYADGVETQRTTPRKRVFGKSNYLLFSTYGYGLYTFSFDWLEQKNALYFNYPYYFWTIDPSDSTIYVSSRSEDMILQINFRQNHIVNTIPLENPGPLLADSQYLYTATTDSPSVVYTLGKDGQLLYQSVIQDHINEIHILQNNQMILCGQSKLYISDPTIQIIKIIDLDSLYFLNGQEVGDQFYFSTTSNSQTKILKYSSNSQDIEVIIPQNSGNSFFISGDTVYYEEIINENRFLVKQIIGGNRLFSKSVNFNITRIKLDQKSDVILLLSQFEGIVAEFSTKGEQITEQIIPYDPVDVLIHEIKSF